jgi:hypothetical protein
MVFACDFLLVCACPVHVDCLIAAVNALAGCRSMRSVFLCVCKYNINIDRIMFVIRYYILCIIVIIIILV